MTRVMPSNTAALGAQKSRRQRSAETAHAGSRHPRRCPEATAPREMQLADKGLRRDSSGHNRPRRRLAARLLVRPESPTHRRKEGGRDAARNRTIASAWLDGSSLLLAMRDPPWRPSRWSRRPAGGSQPAFTGGSRRRAAKHAPGRITPPGESVAAQRSGFPGVRHQLEDVIVPQMAQLFSLEPNWPFPWAKPSDAVTACPAEFA